jgi:ubiquinone/menaquinone biosynthesis C-methylase UbiE
MNQQFDPSMKPIDTREWYDFIGHMADTFPGIHMGGRTASRELLEMCKINGSMHILDVGCGAGHTACQIAKQFGARVDGIDISEVMIDKAKERAKRMGMTDLVNFRVADAFELPFDDTTFDVLLVESVLVPLPGDKLQALHEMMRVLRPGGLLGANESTVAQDAPPELMDAYARHPAIYGVFSVQSLRELFKQAGLVKIQVRETKNVDAPNPMKEMGCNGLLRFFFLTYPKIVLTLLKDARYREASRIDDQITKKSKAYAGYVLMVGRKPV